MFDRQLIVDAKQRMGDRVGDVLLAHIALEVIDIVAKLLDLAKLFFADAAHQAMDLAAVFREVGGDFRREERAGQVGDFQRAVNTVVIRDGHELHAALPRRPIDGVRLDKALRGSDPSQNPFARAVRVLTVDVQIDLGWHASLQAGTLFRQRRRRQQRFVRCPPCVTPS